MASVEEQPVLSQTSNVHGARNLVHERNRGMRGSVVPRGGRGGGPSSFGRGRGRGRSSRPHSSSGDVRVLDRQSPVDESGSHVGNVESTVQSNATELSVSDSHTHPRRGFDGRRGRRNQIFGRGRDDGRSAIDPNFDRLYSNDFGSRMDGLELEMPPPPRQNQGYAQRQSISGDVGVERRDQGGGSDIGSDRRGDSRRNTENRFGSRSRGRESGNSWSRVNEPPNRVDLNEQTSEGMSSMKASKPGQNKFLRNGQERERRIDSGRKKDVAKIDTPQLVQELEVKLATGKVECMICYDNVGRNAPVWSCASCYSIFHMPCIRKWVRAPTSSDISVSAAGNGEANWRCPGCQTVQMSSANELQYYCFCGQVRDPALDYYITPHSCGGPCRKPLDKSKNGYCKHSCTLQCHPGPCPPCTALAPPQSCPCGKTTTTRRCSEQGKDARSCGQQCGRPLPCGRHDCLQICHEGVCEPCGVLFEAKCFCGRREEGLRCWQIEPPGKINPGGVFSCEMQCLKMLSCGNHVCGNNCHPGDCGECELSPSVVRTCPCGKKNLADSQEPGNERLCCTDPIPTCQQICEKILACKKHPCKSLCHIGPCPDCDVPVEQRCRCGTSTRRAACYLATGAGSRNQISESVVEGDDGGLFLCDRKCDKMRSCGRHRCNGRCCPAANNKSMTQSDGPESRDPHLCMLPCGKKLRCKNHSCQELCHPGHCPPCMETTFNELSCACGRTSIPPPVPCGAPLPSCQFPCSVPQVCGHEATHLCHFGDCPPCTVAVAKECVGNHVVLRGVPCGSRDIKCSKLCGKTRQCGLHACEQTCHLPPCDSLEAGTSSQQQSGLSCCQQCGAPRRHCAHTCAASCHPNSPCPEIACKFMVTISCSCGRLTAEVACGAGGSNLRGTNDITSMMLSRLPVPLQPVEGRDRDKIPLGQRKLQCDDECAKLEKRRLLADAFGASVPGEAVPGLEGGVVGSDLLAEIIRRDPQWAAAVEDRFKYLVQGPKSGTWPGGSIRLHVFSAMPKERREVIYQMAERWGLGQVGHGREPRRFVIVHVTPKSKVPMRSLLPKTPFAGVTGPVRAPPFNAQLDMEPGLVVGLLDLPREADVSTLVLRFGGECELVWLNDKNALAIFADAARAATALRRVDHASEYRGATTMPADASSSARGGAWGMQTSLPTGSKAAAFRKGIQESNWVEDAWDDQKGAKQETGAWQSKVRPLSASQNPWSALSNNNSVLSNGLSEGSTSGIGSSVPSRSSIADSSAASARIGNQVGAFSQQGSLAGPSLLPALLPDGDDDDWEKAV